MVSLAPPLSSVPRKRRPKNTLLISPGPWRVEGENERIAMRSIRQPTIHTEILNWSPNSPPRNAARPAAAATPIDMASVTLRPIETSARAIQDYRTATPGSVTSARVGNSLLPGHADAVPGGRGSRHRVTTRAIQTCVCAFSGSEECADVSSRKELALSGLLHVGAARMPHDDPFRSMASRPYTPETGFQGFVSYPWSRMVPDRSGRVR